MKLAVLGGVALVCATTAVVVAQGQATAPQVQTVIGCVKGEGTTQSPWILAGVVIPPPVAAPAGRGGGRGAGGGAGGGAGAPGGAPGGAPAGGAAPLPPAPPPPARTSSHCRWRWRRSPPTAVATDGADPTRSARAGLR